MKTNNHNSTHLKEHAQMVRELEQEKVKRHFVRLLVTVLVGVLMLLFVTVLEIPLVWGALCSIGCSASAYGFLRGSKID